VQLTRVVIPKLSCLDSAASSAHPLHTTTAARLHVPLVHARPYLHLHPHLGRHHLPLRLRQLLADVAMTVPAQTADPDAAVVPDDDAMTVAAAVAAVVGVGVGVGAAGVVAIVTVRAGVSDSMVTDADTAAVDRLIVIDGSARLHMLPPGCVGYNLSVLFFQAKEAQATQINIFQHTRALLLQFLRIKLSPEISFIVIIYV